MMNSQSRYNLAFISLLILHTGILFYISGNFSISYKEAYIYFESFSILKILTNISTSIFGQNDIALRLPFILLYLGSGILLHKLTENYFRRERDRFISIAIFMMLPGVNSAGLLVNESIIVIFSTLLYLYLYKKGSKENYILLFLFLFIDNSFAILYLALFFYSLKEKNNKLLVVSLVLFGLSMSMYGFEVGGRPRGYLLDTFGIYASIFSPFLFLYFFYSLYRIGIKWEKDLIWYISITALGLSLIFSLRQRVAIEDFAPFVVIAIPIMVRLFFHSYRVRLKEFRKNHKLFSSIVLGVLFLNFMLFITNKFLYLVIENPKKHFAYKHHIVKELSEELKKHEINEVFTKNKKLSLRLKFYGIKESTKYYITQTKVKSPFKTIFINYHGKNVATYYILSLK